jgi:hypothetical protein
MHNHLSIELRLTTMRTRTLAMRNSSIAVFTTLKTTIPANAFDQHATFGRPLAPLITRVQSLSESHLGGHTVFLPCCKLKKLTSQ